jgi:C-terminal processing protease CtpA/Prc
MLHAARRAAGAQGEPDLGQGGSLAARLGPALSELLDRRTERDGAGETARCHARGLLLTAVVRTLDPYSAVLVGSTRARVAERFAGHVGGVPIPCLDVRREAGGELVIRIRRLSQTAPDQLDRAVAAAGAERPVERVVLDLRGNSGGSLLAAAALADRFVAGGILVEALDRDDRPVPGLVHRVVSSERRRPAWPLAVLVDERTASSAELLAAALSWSGRASLVGGRTRGKNVVLKTYADETADLTLQLAVAYLRARGRRLPAEGLAPEHEVEPAAALERALAVIRG